jgi:hypothetical protein
VKPPHFQDIPVIINNCNRLTTLRTLIDWLEGAGMRRIFILDNASSYPPLLEYYRVVKHPVVYLQENVGYLALWETAVWHEFADSYYVYSDSDVVPDQACPTDLVGRLLEILHKYPEIEKAGPGLRIDDIPDSNRLKPEIQAVEARSWTKPVGPGIFDAHIDTTLALYRPFARGGYWAKAFRTGPPYVARHLPWYADSSIADTEEDYYRQHSRGSTYWTIRS